MALRYCIVAATIIYSRLTLLPRFTLSELNTDSRKLTLNMIALMQSPWRDSLRRHMLLIYSPFADTRS